MKILITGATGMVGRRLTRMLRDGGMDVSVLTSALSKQNVKQKVFYWSPASGIFPSAELDRPDAVIHLAGANIGARRWTAGYKAEIISSRVETSRFLLQQLLKSGNMPQRYISASGTDFYPNPGDRIYRENDQPGTQFLAAVCVQWEAVAAEWESAGATTTLIRTPVVLAGGEGFLKTMTAGAAFGIIPTTGSPDNALSWIHLKDLCRIYMEAALGKLPGTWNAAAPQAATMRELVHAIDRARGKKCLHPNIPGWLMRPVLGEMSSLACTNQRVSSQKLLDTGFRYLYPEIDDAISHALKH